ncbi:hypothetical protein [Burkholderia territorii]|uniref:hypothetical protein n=1 Tax=Burkholderia territorii TaxID=1503055 RepID=UPI0012D890B1|nr:hypothetical protein [Burkholderia territorii]
MRYVFFTCRNAQKRRGTHEFRGQIDHTAPSGGVMGENPTLRWASLRFSQCNMNDVGGDRLKQSEPIPLA